MDYEGLVFGSEELLKKADAGLLLVAENTVLAHAGVDKEAEGQRKIGFTGEVLDHLRVAILLEREVFLVEMGDDLALPVVNGGQNVDHFHISRKGSAVLS